MRQTFAHMDELGGDAEAFVSALASVAAFSPSDPWHGNGWLFDLVRTVAPEHRARWAEPFGQFAESLSPERVLRDKTTSGTAGYVGFLLRGIRP